MSKQEKVVADLNRALQLAWDTKEQHCNIMDDDDALTVRYAIHDALELLKEQEPVKPETIMYTGAGIGISNCPRCGNKIDEYHNERFCGSCGQKVKWE